MEQEELYKLASELTTKEVIYLAAAHLEHLKNCEFGGTIDADDRIFNVTVRCDLK